ncbi:hypothetical protein E2L07_02430 [Halalkalibacterium halodurans]|uniref:hypothetical protein n=1 Tax=Halalkalibacterium halodurans TaxID=86665 RepID=UPI0010685D6E|nr:hypothetical protein [Halalkalibacterium halodurans]TES57556.1 hypothetical protein E2L07_02430 [Halalkalibacterium halodurans]
MKLEGNILSGEFDQNRNEFTLQKIKHFQAESTLKEGQLLSLYHYLTAHQFETGGQILTLYDQMPIKLNEEELKQLIEDLEKVKEWYDR